MPGTDGKAEGGRRPRGGGVWLPGVVNLALGVPAMIPLHLAWWLWTEYLPMDCRSVAEAARPGLTNCNYTTLDHAGPAMFLLAVSGLLVLGLVLLVDVLLPLRRGGRRGVWLGTAVLVPVPFAMTLALAL
ncbi:MULTISPECIES: hypothetical protein [unclassified Streptomyces]|uniref:hypothetical protein n=1 Tax=unclassified Streptomyces TaxID=2593676 RepID=UPI0033A8F6AE